VLEHASEIVDHSGSNKMGVDALARTLGSNISRSSETDGVAEMLLSHKLFAAMLTSWRSASVQSPPKSDAPRVDSPVLTAPLLPARLSSAQAMTLIQHTEPAAALHSERAAPPLTIDTAAAATPVAAPTAVAVTSPRTGGALAQPVSVGDRVRAPLVPADRSNSSRHAEGTVTRMRLDGSCDVVFNSGAVALGVPRESVLILQSAVAAAGSKLQSPKSKSPGLGSTFRDVVHKLSDPVGLLFNSTTADSTATPTSQPGSPRSSSPSRLAATVSLASAAAKAQSPTDLSTTLGSSSRRSRPLSLPHSRSKEATAAGVATAEEQTVGRIKAVSLSPSSRLSLPSPRSTAHAHSASNSTGSTTVNSVLSKLQAAATSPRSALRQKTAQPNGSSEEPHASTGGYTSTAYATSSGTVDAMTAVVRQTLLDRAAQQTLHYSTVKYKSAYAAAASSGDVPAVESDYHDADFAATGLSRSPSRSPERSAAAGTAATGTATAAAAATGSAAGGKSLPHNSDVHSRKRSPNVAASAAATGTSTGSNKPQSVRVSAIDDQYSSITAVAANSSESGSTAAAAILAQARVSMAAERVQLHRQIYSLQADVSAEAAARAVSERALAAAQAQAAAAAALAQQQQHELQGKLVAAEAQLLAVTRRNEGNDAVDRETQSVLLVQDRLIKSLQVSLNTAVYINVFTARHYSYSLCSVVTLWLLCCIEALQLALHTRLE
jgi:hypothetical protein